MQSPLMQGWVEGSHFAPSPTGCGSGERQADTARDCPGTDPVAYTPHTSPETEQSESTLQGVNDAAAQSWRPVSPASLRNVAQTGASGPQSAFDRHDAVQKPLLWPPNGTRQ
jgi:hypothetical protein